VKLAQLSPKYYQRQIQFGKKMTSDNIMKTEDKVSWWPMLLLAVCIVALWLLSPWFFGLVFAKIEHQYRSNLSDAFSSINALFAGLAFAALFYAISLQRQELSLQRRELRDTRAVLQSQKDEAEKQNTTSAKLATENLLFHLLNQHNEITNNLSLGQNSSREGRGLFSHKLSFIRGVYNDKVGGNGAFDEEKMRNMFVDMSHSIEIELGHYFRSLEGILEYIDHCKSDSKNQYISIMRNQFSEFELVMLFYCCAFLPNLGSLKAKVESNALLLHLKPRSLLSQINHYHILRFSAFECPT
jgi:Putative phage abortive infection protein